MGEGVEAVGVEVEEVGAVVVEEVEEGDAHGVMFAELQVWWSV